MDEKILTMKKLLDSRCAASGNEPAACAVSQKYGQSWRCSFVPALSIFFGKPSVIPLKYPVVQEVDGLRANLMLDGILE